MYKFEDAYGDGSSEDIPKRNLTQDMEAAAQEVEDGAQVMDEEEELMPDPPPPQRQERDAPPAAPAHGGDAAF